MDPPKSTLSQKEYLKRYLMKDKVKRKKKKSSSVSSSSHLKRSVIIDDDINLSDIPHGDNEDFNLDHLGEEAPQIAGYVDERPEEVKLAEKYNSGKWKPFGSDVDADETPNNVTSNTSDLVDREERDLSPPRRRLSPLTPKSNNSKRSKRSPTRDSDSDLELPRKSRDKAKSSSDRYSDRRPKSSKNYDSDQSPPRRDEQRLDSRREKSRRYSRSPDVSRPRRSRRDADTREPRKNERRGTRVENDEQMHDGKKAGLQDAKSLKKELRVLKERENEMFRKMNPELLGSSSAAIVRDRKTGMKRDFEKEKELERKVAAKDAVRRKKYERWGAGLKQVRDQEEKVADVIYEMSKPMARYADDDDLERTLKAQEREGDPMLEYIRRHQKESHTIDLTTGGGRKKYMGSFLPNRFNVVPGHRWDGVDRSNGYEQKWFAAKNAKRAVEEEAWKWSSADM